MRARAHVLSLMMVVFLLAFPREDRGQGSPSPVAARTTRSEALAIIVNRSNPIDNLSFSELRKIFLGERNHWSNGHRIAIVMLDYGQPERRVVLRQVYRMDEKGFEDYVLGTMFRGDVFVAPKTLASPTIVRKFVFNAPGAIGYLRSRDVDDTVKVVRIDGLRPEDKGYRLQIDEPTISTESE